MITKERFKELWQSIIENATVTDPESPNYGRLVSVVNAENPDSIKDTCSPTLKEYLLAVADGTVIPNY